MRMRVSQALASGDLDAAIPLLQRLLTRVDDELAAADLVEHAAHLARWAHDPDAVVEVLDAALTRLVDPAARGRVLHAYARLDAYRSRGADRERRLRAAQAAFRQAGDAGRVALAQGDLAFPLEPFESLAERRTQAMDALELARRSGDKLAVVVCAGTVARIYAELGDSAAYEVWQEGREALPETGPLPQWAADVSPRYFHNWARVLVLWGDYATAGRVIAEGASFSSHRYWERSFAAVEAMRRWRLGDWARAGEDALVALDGDPQPGLDLAQIVLGHLTYERDRRPDTAPLETLTENLVTEEVLVGPLALALLVRIREARREPKPARGVVKALAAAERMGRRMGWEDLLPAAAAVAPALAKSHVERLEHQLLGPRATAALEHAQGVLSLHAQRPGGMDRLVGAADAYLTVGEPYLAARALADAALGSPRSPTSRSLRQRAADMFKEIGAERSLAGVLRGAPGLRPIDGAPIPESQRFAGSPGLTSRESEVAQLASRGYTAREIADELHVAERTVYVHLQSVKAKLGVQRKAQLVRLFDES